MKKVTPVHPSRISPLCWEQFVILGSKAAPGLSLQDHGSSSHPSPFNQRTMLIHSTSWVWFVRLWEITFFFPPSTIFKLFSHLSHFCSGSIFEGPGVKLPAVLIPRITHCTYNWALIYTGIQWKAHVLGMHIILFSHNCLQSRYRQNTKGKKVILSLL